VPLVGAVHIGEPSAPISVSMRDAFEQGLRESDYLNRQDIAIENRYAKDADEISRAVNDLVTLRVDVIMTTGTPASLAVGLVASLSRPGGDLTGNTFLGPELSAKRLQLLRELVPRITRIAGLQHPGVYGKRTMLNMLIDLQERAKEGGIEFQAYDARAPSDFDAAFEAMIKAREDALLVFPSPMFYVNYQRLVDLATAHQLPTMWVFREAVQAGGLICYGADIPDLSRRAGIYVAKILRGAKPSDLPVEQPTRFDFEINLRTAKALRLTVPPTLLVAADEVIE